MKRLYPLFRALSLIVFMFGLTMLLPHRLPPRPHRSRQGAERRDESSSTVTVRPGRTSATAGASRRTRGATGSVEVGWY